MCFNLLHPVDYDFLNYDNNLKVVNGIDLYCSDITQWKISSITHCLSAEEWNSMHMITHKQTFLQKVVSRFLLRNLLHNRYNIDKERLVFEQTDRGKPYLKNHPNLYFNNSHSNEKILIGIVRDHLIGVDIEFVNPQTDEEGVAKYFFSEKEYAQYKEYRCHNEKAFYMFWTAKESVIKALGKGLWERDQLPDIGIDNNGLFLYSNSKKLNDWTLEFLNVDKQYIACVAINCSKSTKAIHLWNIPHQAY